MKKYAKITNEETKECNVAMGNYIPEGYSEMDVEQAYNGIWYVVGYAPQPGEKPKEEILAEKRIIRNRYLQDSDKYMLIDFPITASERNKWQEYRIYLRNFFDDELQALVLPIKTFEEFIGK